MQTLSERTSFLELEIANKADKEEIGIHRQRIHMLEKECAVRAYSHEAQALRDRCAILSKDVESRALILLFSK